MVPFWLHAISIASLSISVLFSAFVAWDETRHPQKMWIMNLVWPLSTLFGSGLVAWGYFHFGRASARAALQASDHSGASFPVMVAKGALHCGSGCTLGDIVAEWLAFAFPAIAIWLGWKSIFAEKMFAVWILDFVLAFLFGVAFQYFTIKPMRKLSPGRGSFRP